MLAVPKMGEMAESETFPECISGVSFVFFFSAILVYANKPNVGQMSQRATLPECHMSLVKRVVWNPSLRKK